MRRKDYYQAQKCGDTTNSFLKTAQRILMAGGESGDIFTHGSLTASLIKQ